MESFVVEITSRDVHKTQGNPLYKGIVRNPFFSSFGVAVQFSDDKDALKFDKLNIQSGDLCVLESCSGFIKSPKNEVFPACVHKIYSPASKRSVSQIDFLYASAPIISFKTPDRIDDEPEFVVFHSNQDSLQTVNFQRENLVEYPKEWVFEKIGLLGENNPPRVYTEVVSPQKIHPIVKKEELFELKGVHTLNCHGGGMVRTTQVNDFDGVHELFTGIPNSFLFNHLREGNLSMDVFTKSMVELGDNFSCNVLQAVFESDPSLDQNLIQMVYGKNKDNFARMICVFYDDSENKKLQRCFSEVNGVFTAEEIRHLDINIKTNTAKILTELTPDDFITKESAKSPKATASVSFSASP